MQEIVDLMAEALQQMETPVELVANRADYGNECVEYTFNTTFFNGARRDVRMKLHIVAATMTRGLEIEQLLDEALVPKREAPLARGATACARNGGGWLVDGDWHIRIAYYDITLRA